MPRSRSVLWMILPWKCRSYEKSSWFALQSCSGVQKWQQKPKERYTGFPSHKSLHRGNLTMMEARDDSESAQNGHSDAVCETNPRVSWCHYVNSPWEPLGELPLEPTFRVGEVTRSHAALSNLYGTGSPKALSPKGSLHKAAFGITFSFVCFSVSLLLHLFILLCFSASPFCFSAFPCFLLLKPKWPFN